MVENFTPVNDNTFDNKTTEETELDYEAIFEESIKKGIHNLEKQPCQNSIDAILNYSKSFKKN